MAGSAPRFRLPIGLTAALLLVATTGAAPVPARAADETAVPASRLEDIQRKLEEGKSESKVAREQAESLAREVAALRAELIAAAAATQKHEAEVGRIEKRLIELGHTEAEMTARLASRRDQYAKSVAALQRIARNPPEALIAEPLSATDMIRSAILLRAAVPEIERRSRALRDDLADLAAVRRSVTERRRQLATATEGLEAERKRLDALLNSKAALKRQADARTLEAEKHVAELARQAKDLRDLMDRLEQERQKRAAEAAAAREQEARAAAEAAARKAAEKPSAAEAAPAAKPADEATGPPIESAALIPFSTARGKLPMPVVGRIVGRYGQATSAGMTRKGISIATRSGAQVINPHDGLVVFAGPFRGYGQILILEHGEGYHTLLAGLASIDAVPGQWLATGEPVGRMETSDRANPVLYVELRRNGQPINPLPWLALQEDNQSG